MRKALYKNKSCKSYDLAALNAIKGEQVLSASAAATSAAEPAAATEAATAAHGCAV